MSTIQFSVRRRDVAWAVALVVLLSSIWVARGDQADAGVTPPPGNGIAVVYIALGTNFPDALGVGPGGGVDGAPVIIVPTNPPIPTATAAELARLDPRTVVIVGGTGVVSQAMQDDLEALLPNATFSRIAGGDRYETNALFSQANFPVEVWISIPTAAFTGVLPATDSVNLTPGAAYSTSGAMYAPVMLPDGAEILAMVANVHDSDDTDGIGVALRRVSFNTNEVIADTLSGDAYAGGDLSMADSIMTVGAEIVDNSLYGYMIEIYASGPTRNLVNVMVHYRLGAP